MSPPHTTAPSGHPKQVRPGAAPATVPRPPVRWLAAMTLALLRRPDLVPVAFRQLWRLAPRGWWHRAPYLPLPPAPYVAFRSQTMYGDTDRLPDPADVCTYLGWCRDFPRAHR